MSGTETLIKHSSIYAIGTISRQLTGFIMLPVYTRYLTPSDYGVIALLNISFVIVERLFGARLAAAIPKFYYSKKEEDADPDSTVSTALAITGVVSLASALFLILFRDNFSSVVFGTMDYGIVVAIFSITLLTGALESYALVYIRMLQKPVLFVSMNICKLVLQIVLNVWLLVFLEMGVLGIAISAAASSTIFAIILTIYTISHTGFRLSKSKALRMVLFAWPLWLSGLAGIYIWSSNRYFIRVLGSLDDVGVFELGAKFASILMVLCWGPFFQYWQTERFNLYNKENADASFRSVFYFVSTFLVICSLGISIFSGPLIIIMAAPEFHDAGSVVPFLVFGTLFAALVEFANFGFLVKENTAQISINAYLIAIFITVLYLFTIPEYGYMGAAVAIMIAQAAYFYLSDWKARQLYDPKISLLPLALMISVAAIGCWIANVLLASGNLLLDIMVKIVVFIGVAGMLVMILVRDEEQRKRVDALKGLALEKFRSFRP